MTMEKQLEPDEDIKLAPLYERRKDDTEPFDLIERYLQYPSLFRHGERTLIAHLPHETGQGRPVRVFETRCPARFFTAVIFPDADWRYLRNKLRG